MFHYWSLTLKYELTLLNFVQWYVSSARQQSFCNGRIWEGEVCPFSKFALDHAHEQNNRTVKGDGGVIGLTQNSPALLCWMVSGPEVARVIHEFQDSQELLKGANKTPTMRHHQQVRSKQIKLSTQVNVLWVKWVILLLRLAAAFWHYTQETWLMNWYQLWKA